MGKSSVGRSLASTLNRPFIDTDNEFSKQAGMTISEYVHKMGWVAFRDWERSILQQICNRDMQIVATGGGVVLDPQNIRSMRETGTLVWLKASPQTIKERISNDPRSEQTRPALSSKGMINEIEAILSQRTPYYEQAMDFSIQTEGLSIAEICAKLVSQLPDN